MRRRRAWPVAALLSSASLTACLTDPAQYGSLGGGGSHAGGANTGGAPTGGAGGAGGLGGSGIGGAIGGSGGEGGVGPDAPIDNVVWSTILGTVGDQSFGALAISPSGNIYAGGRWSGSFDMPVLGGACQSAAASPALLYAVDADGVMRWARCFGSDAEITAVDTNVAGEVAIIGNFLGNINVGGGVVASSARDMFVVLLSIDGDILWGSTFGSSGDDVGQGIALGPSDEIYIAGAFHGPMDIGTAHLDVVGELDLFRAKIVGGQTKWANRIPVASTESEIHLAIRKNGAGPIVAAGTFGNKIDVDDNGTADDFSTPDAETDGFILTFDVSGDNVHFIPVSGPGAQAITSVQTSGNGFAVGGIFDGSVDFDAAGSADPLAVVGQSDAFAAAYDFTGVFQGVTVIGGDGLEGALGVAPPRSGTEVALVGTFAGATLLGPTGVTTSDGDTDAFLATWTGVDAPAPTLAGRLGGVGAQTIRAVGWLDGDIIIAGEFWGTLSIGDKFVTSQSKDAFLARVALP
ncbi:MAG: hypothetical protein U0271_43755 [Polyangiaceae bacterium]